jgi:hypothetical protein
MSRRVALAAVLTAALTLTVGAALGGEVDVRKLPGYVDLEQITIPKDAHEVQDIDLGPALLQLAAEAEAHAGGKLAQALGKIRSLRVKAFSLGENRSDQVRKQIDKIQARLEADAWQRLVYVKDGDEVVTVSVKPAGDHFAGMLVMAYEPGKEAAFVNLVGELSLSTFAEIAQELLKDDKLKTLLDSVNGETAETQSDQAGGD